jgi:hypothetical protein
VTPPGDHQGSPSIKELVDDLNPMVGNVCYEINGEPLGIIERVEMWRGDWHFQTDTGLWLGILEFENGGVVIGKRDHYR